VIEQDYLSECLFQLRKLKAQAEKAIAQVGDEQFFASLDQGANSIGVIMKHVAGNMRSRWTDFLTSDGEKPDRDRDSEFELSGADTRAAIVARWEDGWNRGLATLASLRPDDLGKTVTMRGEPQTVLQAISRQVSHYSMHVGQIVLLAKHLAGPRWQTLSTPKARR
jgi:uncharacterized damage-inducible protein DinB